MSLRDFHRQSLSVGQKLGRMSWGLVVVLTLLGSIGGAMLYSAANGHMMPWVVPQMARFVAGLGILCVVALIDLRFWHRWAYLLHGVAVVLLVVVEFAGSIGMGAQRWLDLWVVQVQPSELVKITLVLALARYFHGVSLGVGNDDAPRFLPLVPAALLILVPTGLVMKQPDLGTGAMLAITGTVVFFAAGVQLRYFVAAGGLVLAALPVAWRIMHDYQQQRILTYLDPDRDPLGAGYHILQSKIALGSGGLFGKGFLAGTQSHLSFLPERQTDFIFTMLAEEFGLIGAFALLALYAMIVVYGYAVALHSASQFGRLLAVGLISVFFLYVAINVAMVTGLVPVVGVPLPLVSYGGTSMLTILFGFGLLASANIHRDVTVPRRPGADTAF
ncbi:MAG: rod shape-determining protein RodA [Alphaproteobacteria bacterium]